MRDPKVEVFLNRKKYQFEFIEKFPIINIDMATSRDNPARLLRSLDEERYMTMADSMETNPDFPAIVLLKNDKDGKVTVASGMHRLMAAQKVNLKTFDAYLVTETISWKRDLLIRVLNTMEGQVQTKTENLLHAAAMLEEYPNLAIKAIAKDFTVHPQAITDLRRVAEFDKRCRKLKISEEAIAFAPRNLKQVLMQIREDERLKRTMNLIKSKKITGEEAKEFARKIAHVGSPKAADEIFNEYETIYKERKSRTPSPYNKCDTANKIIRKGKSSFELLNANEPSKVGFDEAFSPTELRQHAKIFAKLSQLYSSYAKEMLSILKQQKKIKKEEELMGEEEQSLDELEDLK